MDHAKCVEWRRKYYNLLKKFKLEEVVEELGDPEEMIRAEKLLKKGGVKFIWMGPCENGNTFDVVVRIPSLSSERYYTLAGKLERIKDNLYTLKEIIELEHTCEETIYRRKVKRLPGPDHHEIAFYKVLQYYLPMICAKKGCGIKKVLPFYKKVPEDAMKLYDYLVKKRYPALERKKILFEYLRKRERRKRRYKGETLLDKWI